MRTRMIVSVVLAVSFWAQISEAQTDVLGIYTSADEAGVEYVDLTVPSTLSVYLVLRNGSELGGVGGYECRLELDPGISLTGVTLPPGGSRFSNLPDLVVYLPTPVPFGPNMLLGTLDLFVMASPVTIRLQPASNPTIPGEMVYLPGDDPGRTVTMEWSSGSSEAPVFGINTGPLFGGTFFVDDDAGGADDGSSWTDAFDDLQEALAAVHPGDEIWVAEGVYTPSAVGDRRASFELPDSVEIYGGFSGSEIDRTQRDWQANQTILSGDIGVLGDPSDNTNHIVIAEYVGSGAVLDGFVVADAWNSSPGHESGAGIHCYSASPVFRNLVVTRNAASYGGGGMWIWGDSTPTLIAVTFTQNSAAIWGGGLCIQGTACHVENAHFSRNLSSMDGGAIFAGGPVTLQNVTIADNVAIREGGGAWFVGVDQILTNVTFTGNVSHNMGGGMYVDGGYDGELLSFNNGVFYDNHALNGGGLWLAEDVILTNISISGNRADSGAGIYVSQVSPALANVILWGNALTTTDREFVNVGGMPSITHSIVGGSGGSGGGWDPSLGIDGGGNLDVDPLFMDAALGNLRLHPSSAAIDAGDSTALPLGIAEDLDGNARVVGSDVDMGAYEFFEALEIMSIEDVPDDQGGLVRMELKAASSDVADSPGPIVQYEAFRRIETPAESDLLDADLRGQQARELGMLSDGMILTQGWEFAAAIPAHAEPIYSMIAPTLADAVDPDIQWSVFFVRAATADPDLFYDSLPDSGYSVDNLAPGVPTGIIASYEANAVTLDWDDAPEPDFQFYRVYRSLDPGFVPSTDNLVHETASSTWTDPVTDPWDNHYKITTLDHAGNESVAGDPASISSVLVDGVPARIALLDAFPNPFNPITTVAFDLPSEQTVSLRIYDMGGRLVDTLLNDELASAGRNETVWRGRDTDGRIVPAGVYFYRLSTGGFSETKRMTLVK